MEKSYKYYSTGLVLGYLWGGGKGSYPAKKFEADTKEDLLDQAKKALVDGSLDSGMGFERLLGALINIEEITTILVDGKEYYSKSYEHEFIGHLSEKEKYFLEESMYHE